MSFDPSPKDKLAEALLRLTSSRRNYEVIPPAPSSVRSDLSLSSDSSDAYITTSSELAASSSLDRPEASLHPFPLPFGYSSVPAPLVSVLAPKSVGDYYLSSSTSNLGASVAIDPRMVARSLAQRLAQDMHLNRDFNKDYQVLMEAAESKPDDLEILTELRLLTKEFLDTAQSVGCIIIDELFEPHKTIPPVDIGGIAGGVKYVYRNILYKICLDTELDEHRGWMHGGSKPSHEKAMKTGAHELRGIMHYSSLRVSGLHFPLMLVMDYKGFRLVAEALLPINKETIKYGSSDGGETVHADGEQLCQMMRTVGQELHLAQHIVKDRTLFGPGDQEVHLGLDGRYYCIDLARVFPCEPARHHLNPTPSSSTASASSSSATKTTPTTTRLQNPSPPANSQLSPMRSGSTSGRKTPSPAPPITTPVQEEPRSIFYKFFRPEFVLSYKKPLACDCFTAWGKSDPMFQQNNKDVVDAFLHLKSLVIPKFAATFDKMATAIPRPTDARDWWVKTKPLEEIHACGINIRLLGLLRSQCVVEFARVMLLNEMMARTVKNLIRKRLREEMAAQTRLSQEQVKEIVIQFYNWVLGKGSTPTMKQQFNHSSSTAAAAADQNLTAPVPVLRMSGPPFVLERSTDSVSSASSNEGISSPLNATAKVANGFGPTGALASQLPKLSTSTTSSSPSSSSTISVASIAPRGDAQSSTSKSASSNTISPLSSVELTSSSPSPWTASSSTVAADSSFPDEVFLDQFYFQFESALMREEVKDPSKTIRQQFDRRLFFSRLNQMLGIEMDAEAEKELFNTTSYEFVHCDISSIAPRVRFMNLVDESEGLALFITAKQKRNDQRKRLLKLSTLKFQASCASLPHNFNGLFYWGRSLYEEAKLFTHDRKEKIRYLELALSKLELVTKLRPGHARSWIIQVRIWLKLFETPEYQERIGDRQIADPLSPDFSFLTDHLGNACTRLMRLNLFLIDKLLRRARAIFSQAQAGKVGEPTALLRIVESICVSIQSVCGPMIDAMPSVPLPPDALEIKLPRIHVESLLLCARSLQLRSQLAAERVLAAKPMLTSRSSQQLGINQDELHSKRLKFQIAEQFTAALGTKHTDDAAYFDRLLIESLPEISPLIKSSKNLAQGFQERCRLITKVHLSSSSTSTSSSSASSLQNSASSSQASSSNSLSAGQLSTSSPNLIGAVSTESVQIFVELALPHVGPKLTSIDVSGCKQLSLPVLTQLFERSSKTLTSLDISELPFVSNVWLQTSTSQLKEMVHLSVRELKISDDTAVALCQQHGMRLKTLDIASNHLTNYGLYRMARELKCLEMLDLSGNGQVGGAHPIGGKKADYGSDFANAMTLLRPSLTSLSMLECYSLTNHAVWDISVQLRNLKHLALTSKQITDQYLMKLEPLVGKLESLSLRGLSNSDAPFVHLLKSLGPACLSLSLRACMGITDESIEALSLQCTNLRTLHLGLCLLVHGPSLASLSTRLHSLVELDLSGLSIDPSIVVQFVSAQPRLEVLNISSLDKPLGDSSVIEMLQNTPLLRDLNMASNQRITAKTIEALARLTPKLEALNLTDCHSLQSFESHIQRLKRLAYLNIRYAHPPKMHCLVNPKFSHVKTLVTCSCAVVSRKLTPEAELLSTSKGKISN